MLYSPCSLQPFPTPQAAHAHINTHTHTSFVLAWDILPPRQAFVQSGSAAHIWFTLQATWSENHIFCLEFKTRELMEDSSDSDPEVDISLIPQPWTEENIAKAKENMKEEAKPGFTFPTPLIESLFRKAVIQAEENMKMEASKKNDKSASNGKKKVQVEAVQTVQNVGANTKTKRNPPVKSKPVGFLCINKLMDKVMRKVITKAKNRASARKSAADNPERKKEADKRGHQKNRKHRLQTMREYQKNNREKLNAKQLVYEKNRRKSDITFKLKGRMRARLGAFLRDRNIPKTGRTFNLIGCTPSQLKEYLCGQMKNLKMFRDMEADHIFPLSMYRIQEQKQQEKAMNFTNMQPLTKYENEIKLNKLPTKAMAAKVNPDCWPDGITIDMLPDIYPGWATPLRMSLEEEEDEEGEETRAGAASGVGSSMKHALMDTEESEEEEGEEYDSEEEYSDAEGLDDLEEMEDSEDDDA